MGLFFFVLWHLFVFVLPKVPFLYSRKLFEDFFLMALGLFRPPKISISTYIGVNTPNSCASLRQSVRFADCGSTSAQ